MFRIWIVICAASFCSAGYSQHAASRAQPDRTASASPVSNRTESSIRRDQISGELSSAKQALEAAQAAGAHNEQTDALARKIDLLKQLDVVLAQLHSAESTAGQLDTRRTELQIELEAVRAGGVGETGPYSFLYFDSLQNELKVAQLRQETVQATVDSASAAVEKAARDHEAAAANLRRAKEQLQLSEDTTTREALELARTIAAGESELAETTLTFKRRLLEIEKIKSAISALEIDILTANIKWVSDDVEFSDTDLQNALIEIEKQENQLREAIISAEFNLQYAVNQEADAKQQLEQTDSVEAKEKAIAKRKQRELRQHQVEVLNQRLGRLNQARESWNRRFKVVNGLAQTGELTAWQTELAAEIEATSRERRVQLLRADEERQQLARTDVKLQGASEVPGEHHKWIEAQQQASQQLLRTFDQNVSSIDSKLELTQNLLDEILGDIQTWTFAEQLAGIGDTVLRVWRTEVTSVDDRPITIGKIIVSLILLVVGFFAARLISRLFGNRLLVRFGMHEGAVAAIKSIAFYTLIVIFGLLSLRFANVPLTIFTLLGGALAIGVGFGSQAIINNFISGLILLAERPIKVGDLVKLDDLVGNVVHIGARSTRIRTGDNLDIIVPNSRFLENNVLNYTLGDDNFRSHIRVGIAYGSPTREATKLLIRAADEHGMIMRTPKPFVWFRDFGDNSLVLELHVWIQVRTLAERLRIESDLRYRVDQLFREAGIVIAFPQRDVHVDASKPLEIRMLPAVTAPQEPARDDRRADAA